MRSALSGTSSSRTCRGVLPARGRSGSFIDDQVRSLSLPGPDCRTALKQDEAPERHQPSVPIALGASSAKRASAVSGLAWPNCQMLLCRSAPTDNGRESRMALIPCLRTGHPPTRRYSTPPCRRGGPATPSARAARVLLVIDTRPGQERDGDPVLVAETR
jgi:hypothetical protein